MQYIESLRRECKSQATWWSIREVNESNLISLGMLDQTGYNIKFEFGELNIGNRSITIIKETEMNRV